LASTTPENHPPALRGRRPRVLRHCVRLGPGGHRRFAKILADPNSRLLLGAHIISPQASALIQPLIQAMSLGNTIDELASEVLYIHPALPELIQQALLEL
jgi:pyruvate/2-oxoglutarate dehydrogenase complex dihydrolipoamide dehydrogenase (E3) component